MYRLQLQKCPPNPGTSFDASRYPTSPAPASKRKKRPSAAAALDDDGNPSAVRRRATKACAACHWRKVRCDAMQRYHTMADAEVACSNCNMRGIKCVIGGRGRRIPTKYLDAQPAAASASAPAQEPVMISAQTWQDGFMHPTNIANLKVRRWSGSTALSNNTLGTDFATSQYVPHSIYQNMNQCINQGKILQRQDYDAPPFEVDPTYALLRSASLYCDLKSTQLAPLLVHRTPKPKHALPRYLKPLPQQIIPADIDYLFAKGALSLPDIPVRNALFQGYLEFVHPYMPVIEVHKVMGIIEEGTGASGRISLLLLQAILFAGTAFVDMDFLRSVGFSNRRVARKAFFQKAKILYDFNYELDCVTLVQSLLLMTYWHETLDVHDTWHWMGVAISLAYTIGMHRNPENYSMEPWKKKMWKRIWWSCFMRDRLMALGMRRPMRVKDEDFDVPMLTEDDFEIASLPEHITVVPRECRLARDVKAQRKLAQMCIAKAKLCFCISHVLNAQYSVQALQSQKGSTRSSVMLLPKKLAQMDEVRSCDLELSQWIVQLPPACQYSSEMGIGNSATPIFVNKALLNMMYFTAVSTLHRPQVHPSTITTRHNGGRELPIQDASWRKVREASQEITRISQDLYAYNLEKYLPTTGVTALLPAIMIHLLDIKSYNYNTRQTALNGFCQCMLVLERLQDNYAFADLATQILEAANQKADIDVMIRHSMVKLQQEDPSAALSIEKVEETHRRLQTKRWIPPLSDGHSIKPDLTGSRTVESTSTARGTGGDIDLNDSRENDFANEMWNNVPFYDSAHDHSGGLMCDMDWVDQTAEWRYVTNLSPGAPQLEMQNTLDNEGLVEVQEALAEPSDFDFG